MRNTELERNFRYDFVMRETPCPPRGPGFGENSRVLKWVFERCDGAAAAEKTRYPDRIVIAGSSSAGGSLTILNGTDGTFVGDSPLQLLAGGDSTEINGMACRDDACYVQWKSFEINDGLGYPTSMVSILDTLTGKLRETVGIPIRFCVPSIICCLLQPTK